MFSMSIATDISQLKVKLFELRSDVINKAIPSALNKTTAAARTQVVRAIRLKIKNMKAARIKKRITLIRATRSNYVAIIRGWRVNIPPGAFKLPGHGDKLFVHVGKKHRMIESMSGKFIGKRISSGYQIAPVQSVQVIEEFSKRYAQELMVRVVREKFAKTFENEMKYFGRR